MTLADTTPLMKMCLERPCGCAAMKAPVGLSSRRAVCDSRWKDFVLTSVGAAPNTKIKMDFPLKMPSNDDDRRQRRKQGGVVGAAASKTDASAAQGTKRMLGAATRKTRRAF